MTEIQRRYDDEFYQQFLYEALSGLEAKENAIREQEERNREGIEGLSEAWTVTIWEDDSVEEFVHSFHGSEQEAWAESVRLEKLGVKRGRITIYRPGELFAL
jgi:hypothetical protein